MLCIIGLYLRREQVNISISIMKSIVTGGAGFLGSHLCDKLLEMGDEVACIDNLLTGNLDNIKHLQNDSKFTFIQHDVTKQLPANLDADRVYHLASPASPNQHSSKSYHALPFETMMVNTTGTWNLAEFATKAGAKFLFASTSESYGEPLEHPQKEEYRGNVSTTGPRSVYDEAKRFGETITAAFVRSKGLDGRTIRIFNTYGSRMALDDGRAVIEFVTTALKNKPIPVFGDGTQVRSFCYVSDLIDGIIAAMEMPKTTGEIFNIGNTHELTILELAHKIKAITASSSEIVFAEKLPTDDPSRRCPDITKAKTILRWEPKVDLISGLTSLVKYLKESNF